MIKVGIIWANLNSPNLGVSALAYSALVIFEEISKRNNVSFEYYLWGRNTQTRNIEINSNTITINELKYFLGGDKFRYLKDFIRRPRVFLNYRNILTLKKCDILVDTGEGDSYADIYGLSRFRNFNYIKTKFYDSKVPYILLPQTIGPFESNEAKLKAKTSLEKMSAVIARDSRSYEFCKTIAPDSNLSESIDMAFFLPYDSKIFDCRDQNKINIGVNVSGLLWNGGYTRDNQFGLIDNYRDLIVKLLDYLNSKSDAKVHLIGHVIGEPTSIDEDMHVLSELKRKYPSFKLAPAFHSPIDAKSYISNMDFFTGSRMHACIAAISSGVPVIPMAYSRKFNGLFCDTLRYPEIIDLKTDRKDMIFDKFKNALENRIYLSERIIEIRNSIINPQKENLIHLLTNYIVK